MAHSTIKASFSSVPLLTRRLAIKHNIYSQCTTATVGASQQHGNKASKSSSTATTAIATKSCNTSQRNQIMTRNSIEFWTSRQTWARSGINTFRCLVGCTSGDFATMWYLQSTHPDLSTITTMSLSMAAGITTSIILESLLLCWGRDRLPLRAAVRTATGMSMISMLAMELTENAVDYNLTGGIVDFGNPYFWTAAGLSATAGFLVPLPYNYFRLRAYNASCH